MKQQLWLAVLLAVVSLSVQQNNKCATKEQVLNASPYFPRFSVDFKAECNKYWAGNEDERVPCVIVANQVTSYFARNMGMDEQILAYIYDRLHTYAAGNDKRMVFLGTAYFLGADGSKWGNADELLECLAVNYVCTWKEQVLNRNTNGVTHMAAALTKMCTAVPEQSECTTLKNDVNSIISGSASNKLSQIAAKLRTFIGTNTKRMTLMGANDISGLTATHKLLDFINCHYQGECPILKHMIAADSPSADSYASIALQAGCKGMDGCADAVLQFKQSVHNNLQDAVRLNNAKYIMRSVGLDKYKHSMIGTWGTINRLMLCSI